MSTKLLLQGLVVVGIAMYVLPNITGGESIGLDTAVVLGVMCIIGFILVDILFPGIENYDSKDDYEADFIKCQKAKNSIPEISGKIKEFITDIDHKSDVPRNSLYWYMRGKYPKDNLIPIALGDISEDPTKDRADIIVSNAITKLQNKDNQYLRNQCAEGVRKQFELI